MTYVILVKDALGGFDLYGDDDGGYFIDKADAKAVKSFVESEQLPSPVDDAFAKALDRVLACTCRAA